MSVNLWRTIAVLLDENNGIEPGARRVLAALAMSGPDGQPAVPGKADDFIRSLRELYDKGWIGVADGRAYPSEPVRGPLGNLVERKRLDDDGFKAAALFVKGGLL